MSRKHLTQDELKAILEYCPKSGNFTWRVPVRRGFVGKLAGNIDTAGYCIIRYRGRAYKAHRLAFLYTTGGIPTQVDHIDLDKSNNIWNNLRACSAVENCRNRMSRKTLTGIKNVFFEDNRYRVRLKVGEKLRNFGSYKDLELAELVAIEARERYHGEFVRHSL